MICSKAVKWASIGVCMSGVLGCDTYRAGDSNHQQGYNHQPPRPVYEQPQPVYVEPQPQYIFVRQAPPPMRVERRPPPPAYVWIDGYWNWENQQYSWQPGRYVIPPQPDLIWVAAHYDSDVQGYRYTPGQWSKQNQGNGHGRGGD